MREECTSYGPLLIAFLWITWTAGQNPKDNLVNTNKPVVPASCPTGWFGEECRYKCQCLGGYPCELTTGECPPNVPCETAMFGPECQYVDLLTLNWVSSNPFYLNDRNMKTCNPDQKATRLNVSLSKPRRFLWFRLHTIRDMSQSRVKVEVDNGNCLGLRMYRVSENILDISCDTRKFLSTLHITGAVVGHICDIQISGGRNVALKQHTEQSSEYQKEPKNLVRSSNAVDGSVMATTSSGSCSITDFVIGAPWWTLTFNRVMIIFRIVVYFNYEDRFRLRSIKLNLYKTTDSTSGHYALSYSSLPEEEKYVFSHDIVSATDKVTILKIHLREAENVTDNVLSVCEVETYGETLCDENVDFGLYCQSTCQCQKDERCSLVHGACGTPCVSVRSLWNCSYPCPPHCLDQRCSEEGECFNCTPGYHGTYCYDVCPVGTYGHNCSGSCSRNCKTWPCDRANGHCDDCLGNQLMPFCVDECSKGTYGQNCTQQCPVNCKNEVCDIKSGGCFACAGGQDVPLCHDKDDVKQMLGGISWIYFLPLLLLLPIAMCCLCFFMRRRKQPEAETVAEREAPAREDVAMTEEMMEELRQTGSSVDFQVEDQQ